MLQHRRLEAVPRWHMDNGKLQNVTDKAVGHWTSGYVHVRRRKDITLNIC